MPSTLPNASLVVMRLRRSNNLALALLMSNQPVFDRSASVIKFCTFSAQLSAFLRPSTSLLQKAATFFDHTL